MDILYVRSILVEVLIYHRPKQDSSCHCGWAQLGRSWPEHIAHVYEMCAPMEEAKSDLVCSMCVTDKKEENPENDDRLTVINGTLICMDHVPELHKLFRNPRR